MAQQGSNQENRGRETRAQETRARILQVAAEAFAEHGFDGVLAFSETARREVTDCL